MLVVTAPAESIRLNQPLPFALRNAAGMMLLPRGAVISSEEVLQEILERGIYVAVAEADAFKRAVAGKMGSMMRGNERLGLIAKVEDEIDAEAVSRTLAAKARIRRNEVPPSLDGLAVKMAMALREPARGDFLDRINDIDEDLLTLLASGADGMLLSLIYSASTGAQKYSVRHSLLVAVIVELAARQIEAWPLEWRAPLRRAAITMNVVMTNLQDQLATQESSTSALQREAIDTHAQRGALVLRHLGVTDELWLQAVEMHHSSAPGPLALMQPAAQLARLINRADVFAARLSPRGSRRAMAATAASRAAYLDENQQTDEAGTAIIKATGIYPPGSFVKLAGGEIAIVIKRGARATAPVVASVVGAKGLPLSQPVVRDSRQKAHEITGAASPREVMVRLSVDDLIRLS
jgi:HD-GYP domain-containing protein (c-di-GMP phosphodiesterase class II)